MPIRQLDLDGCGSAGDVKLSGSPLPQWLDGLRLDRADDDYKRLVSPTQKRTYATPKQTNSLQTIWSNVARDDFENVMFIARGSFGKVSLVRHKLSQRLFALKEMAGAPGSEDKVIQMGLEEANILKTIKHPFIVNFRHVFLDYTTVCLAMDYVPGHDLWSLIYEKKEAPMEESRAKFYLAQLALAIEYLHDNDIIYSDLKTENVIIDDKGYVRLVDFGCARRLRSGENSRQKCGTIQCLAPEALAVYFDDAKGYSFPADYWSLGVVAYEIMVGAAPFTFDPANESPKQFAQRVPDLCEELSLPPALSEPAIGLIRELLNPSPCNRLGRNIRKHRFFADIDFNMLLQQI